MDRCKMCGGKGYIVKDNDFAGVRVPGCTRKEVCPRCRGSGGGVICDDDCCWGVNE